MQQALDGPQKVLASWNSSLSTSYHWNQKYAVCYLYSRTTNAILCSLDPYMRCLCHDLHNECNLWDYRHHPLIVTSTYIESSSAVEVNVRHLGITQNTDSIFLAFSSDGYTSPAMIWNLILFVHEQLCSTGKEDQDSTSRGKHMLGQHIHGSWSLLL